MIWVEYLSIIIPVTQAVKRSEHSHHKYMHEALQKRPYGWMRAAERQIDTTQQVDSHVMRIKSKILKGRTCSWMCASSLTQEVVR